MSRELLMLLSNKYRVSYHKYKDKKGEAAILRDIFGNKVMSFYRRRCVLSRKQINKDIINYLKNKTK